jgi:DNA-binding SARP family transcriptional activator
MSLEEKHQFWDQNFKSAFVNNMEQLISGRVSTVLRIFDAFREFEYYDEEIWDKIITMMDNKTGWVRTAII